MSTTMWAVDELRWIGGATELQVASYRTDGSLWPYTTIWTVAAGDGVFFRSAYGPDNGWFAARSPQEPAASGPVGSKRDVEFTHLDPGDSAHAVVNSA